MTETNNNTELLSVARRSIEYGLHHRRRWLPSLDEYPAALQADGACFVTLKRHGDLRGCVGTLEAIEPLVVNVARNAYTAAFDDPRFPALMPAELPEIELSLSLLTPAEPLEFHDEDDLLAALEPGRDGLIIQHQLQRATFLPSVWESLEEPQAFLQALKRKAGMAADTVPTQAWRYRCETVSETARA